MFSNNYGYVLHRYEIFDFEKYCDLEIRVRGHSRSSNLVPFNAYGCLLAPYSNFVSKTHRF